ncbi:hypothetical protein Golomagni_06608 [Golovinomyces magnicellulatus]|nr:hypothetical protein Golomagni_06608 [Golovinomyces magnicellulatus]
MLFTRAAMSCARSVRLTQMMGLDRLDGNNDNLPPALGPTQSWIELEERRRTLWGTFAIDCHASISTGWPNLLISSNIRTRLPASEAAFASGEEEIAPFLEEAIKGAHYSSFAGTIVVCEGFKGILNHIHREHSEDHPEDLQSGKFWKRHRELDNNLSSTFMFLPEAFRLPQNVRDPAAIYANLNLHASVICLHHASLEMAEKHNLSDSVRKASITRLKTSAEEIVNIVKLTSHHTTIFRSPLCSLALYCATTVFIYLAKESGTGQMDPMDVSSLDIVIRGMQAISRHHKITNAFLQQAFMDIERNGLSGSITMPWFSEMANSDWTSNIPMLARSVVSRHTNVAPVLPGRLPLNNPQGKAVPMNNKDGTFIVSRGTSATVKKLTNSDCYQPMLGAVSRNMIPVRGVNKTTSSAPSSGTLQETPGHPANKRKRTGPSPAADGMSMPSGMFDTGISNPDMMDSSRNGFEMFVLPDRSTSSNSSSPAYRTATSSSLADVLSSMSGASPVGGLGNTPEENRVDFSAFQDKISGPIWSTEEEIFMKQMADSLVNGSLPGAVSQPWDFVTSDMPWQSDQQPQ